MKSRVKLTALICAILIALAFPITSALAVVSPDGTYCMDRVGVISAETKAYIYERNKNLEQSCSGAQMCVVVLDTINGADIEEYAYDIFTSWKIGRSGQDNGVLILMLTGDDNYWIMPGTGLESVLTVNMLSSTINAYCEPSFAAKDYDTAVKKTFERLNEEICNHYRANPSGVADPSQYANEGFVGGGSGSGASNYNNGGGSQQVPISSSCRSNDYWAYTRPSCASCSMLRGCASCAFACGSCAGCGSCGGIGGIILAFLVIYVIIQVLRYIGRGSVSRVNRAGGFGTGGTYYRRPGFFGTRFGPARPRFTSFRSPFGGAGRAGGSSFSGSRPGSGAGRPFGSSGFSGGGGSTRGGGTGRSYSNRSGFTTRGGFSGGSFKGFSGGSSFKGGGGGTRGGGAGRRK